MRTRAVKPYLTVGVGPVVGVSSGSGTNKTSAIVGTRSAVTAGGNLGGGVDVLAGRSWSIGANAGYAWMADFSKPIGGRDSYNGFNLSVGAGWLFGK